MRFDSVGELRISRRPAREPSVIVRHDKLHAVQPASGGAPSVLPALATPIPAARNQTLNSSLHAIREPGRPDPLVFHRGANRLQPLFKSRTSSLYALVNVSTCAFKIPYCSLMYLLHLTYPC